MSQWNMNNAFASIELNAILISTNRSPLYINIYYFIASLLSACPAV